MHWRKRVTINLLATWGDHVVGLAVCLVLMPYTLGVLGDDDYGLWVFINAFAGYSGLLNLGFGQTISRYVSAYRAKQDDEGVNRVVNWIGTIYLLMGSIAIAIAGVLAWLTPIYWPPIRISVQELQAVIVILGINAAVGIVGSVFGGVLIGLQRWDLERAVLVTSGFARLGLTMGFLRQESGLFILSLITLGTTLVENTGLVWLALRKAPELRFGRRYLHAQTFRECLHFSSFSLLDSLAGKIIENIDSIVIGSVLGPKAIVPFTVASRLCQMIVRPLQLIGQICLPQAGEYFATGQLVMLRELLTKAMGLALLLVGGYFIGAWYFGPLLMQTWLHKSYPESQQLLLILLVAQFVGTPMKVVSGVLYGMGEARRPALTYLLEAFGKLALSLALILPLGLFGAAIATAVPMICLELGLLLPFVMRRLSLPIARIWRDTVLPQLLPLGALWAYSALVVTHVPQTPSWPKLLMISGGGGVVLAGIWFFQRGYSRIRHRKWLETRAKGIGADDPSPVQMG